MEQEQNVIKDYAARVERVVSEYEDHIAKHLDEEYVRKTSWSDRLADNMAAFGGSWKFIIFFSGFLFIWIIWNITPFLPHFDRTPFILLNLLLSFLASFQAPIIMMSQNRQAKRDKNEAVIDFAVNWKSESEVDDIQQHLHRLEDQINDIKKLLEGFQNEKAI